MDFKFCERCFLFQVNITKHVRRHIGERKHNCEFCSKAFIKKQELKNRLRVHDKQNCLVLLFSIRDKLIILIIVIIVIVVTVLNNSSELINCSTEKIKKIYQTYPLFQLFTLI